MRLNKIKNMCYVCRQIFLDLGMLENRFKMTLIGLFFLLSISSHGIEGTVAVDSPCDSSLLGSATSSPTLAKRHRQEFIGQTTSVSKIPVQDRECLNQFFQYLLYKGSMGYTLFGTKPISEVDYPDPKCCIGSDLGQSLLIEKGWETWMRYQDLFPSNEFILKKEKNGLLDTNTILLMNKTQILSAISQNLDLFQNKFGKEVLPEKMLSQICNTNEPLFQYLDDEALIGILLGFGRTNGILFKRECEIADYLQAQLTPPFSCLKEIKQLNLKSQKYVQMRSKRKLLNGSKLATLFPRHVEEFNSIINRREFFELPGDDWFLTSFGSPRFIDYGEDPKLVDSYVKTRRTIRKAYRKGSFLQVTLNQWTNPQFPGQER